MLLEETKEKCKEIMNSNLSDDLKFELIGMLQSETKTEYIPYPVSIPDSYRYPMYPNPLQPSVTWSAKTSA